MSTGAVGNPSIYHSDPIAPVIFGVTLILVAALIGRYSARRFGQPSVLGELLMGVVLGNLLFVFDYELMVILREGTGCLRMGALALSGVPWEEAAVQALVHRARERLRVIVGKLTVEVPFDEVTWYDAL